MSQTVFGQTNRQPLLEEAFKGLPYFMSTASFSLIGTENLSAGFYVVNSFSPEENEILKQLLEVALRQHRDGYKIVFCGPSPCLDRSGRKVSFKTKDSSVERTAVTSPIDPLDDIFLNVKRINDPSNKLDFVEAIQLLFHELSRKIQMKENPAIDKVIAKIINVLRQNYSVFSAGENRRIHILTIQTPTSTGAKLIQGMKNLWLEHQGFEVTTFDERNGTFTSIDEVRHNFADPKLVVADEATKGARPAAQNSILGVEVDRFSDSTTIIRIASHQKQAILSAEQEILDYSSNFDFREHVIKLQPGKPVQSSIRQGYLNHAGPSAVLQKFEFQYSILKGNGYLPYRRKDFKDHNLFLVVRHERGLLNIPLRISPTDPEGATFFTFERKMNFNLVETELLATDVLVEGEFGKPLEKLSLDSFQKVKLRSSGKLTQELKLQDILNQMAETGKWTSMKSPEVSLPRNENWFKFIFASATPLQELTLYIGHTNSIYDPNEIAKTLAPGDTSNPVIVPNTSSQKISNEYEQETFRIDASQMEQKFNNGLLEVTFPLQIRGSTKREKDFENSTVWYGLDTSLEKRFTKIVAVNQNLKSESLTNPSYRGLQTGPVRMTPLNRMPKNCRSMLAPK